MGTINYNEAPLLSDAQCVITEDLCRYEADFDNAFWENHMNTTIIACEEVTEHMFDRLFAGSIGPKFDRAQRYARKMQLDGPHTSSGGTYRGVWDRMDEAARRARINRMLDRDMQAEAAYAMSVDAVEDAIQLRQPAYADCAQYYYDTLFNPEAIRAHERAEEDRFYWE